MTVNGATPGNGVLDRVTVTARREAIHAELLAAMQTVERFRGALAMLDELLSLEDCRPVDHEAPPA